MKITLNKESWHSRFYKWAIKTEDLPKTLCPYFWIMLFIVLTSPVLIVVRSITWIFGKIGQLFKKKEKEILSEEEEFDRMIKQTRRMVLASKIVLTGSLLLLITMVTFVLWDVHHKHSWKEILVIFFMFVGMITTVILSIWGLIALIKALRIERITETRIWIKTGAAFSIIWAALVGIKEKACPIINWSAE
jgi:MFS family permease